MTEERKVNDQKKQLRKQLLAKRDSLTREERIRGEILITERILGHQWFYRSEILLGYVSVGSEIATGEILDEAVKKGKKVYVPRVFGEDLIFIRYYSRDDLELGYKGIPEPKEGGEVYQYNEQDAGKTLLLMPGVGFDSYRNRMGYGKGFYDRFLADKEGLNTRSIAIGYSCQMVSQLPCEEHDRKPYQVICV